MSITLDLKERGGEGMELVGWEGRNEICVLQLSLWANHTSEAI